MSNGTRKEKNRKEKITKCLWSGRKNVINEGMKTFEV